eukprot:gene33251-42569_t
MILNRLFTRLFAQGLILVATSNRAPDRLYERGLQRELFLPFIDLLKKRCRAHDIQSSTDYRRLGVQLLNPHYFQGHKKVEELWDSFLTLSAGVRVSPATLEVAFGRSMEVASAAGECAWFTFAELCEKPLAAADYIALC